MSNPHQHRNAIPLNQPRQASLLSSRRPPANRSVSLRHSPSKLGQASAVQNSNAQQAALNTGQTSNQTEVTSTSDGSPSSLRPLNGRGSSGESSNADTWFDQSNNAPRDDNHNYADNDPPFFMRHGSSSESPPEGHVQQQHLRQYLNHDGSQSLPLRAGQMKLGTPGGSSAEDFRGVIDDLTIENKKLKRRLKKYEKLHDAHLKNDKLFEIRVHGLEADKKRELEELLRNFAGNLATQQPSSGFPSNGYEGILPGLKSHQTESSHASMHHTDSAYASMSASGQGSSAPSGGDSKHRHIIQAAKSRQQNIHTFLHHIPEGLQPNHNPEAMTERAKKKLVVRRLEQIFAGTDAIAGPHHQALQQQDVSHMAAHADRKSNEAHGHQADMEGLRESAIMEQETEDPLDIGAKRRSAAKEHASLNHQEPEKVAEYDFADQSPDGISDDQRPTRPLDLDPDRAQVPADNVRYIRHLGFSPQDPEYSRTPEDGHGWVYLNLLVNMAQLHTIHVTAEFVRKAVTDCSDHFEVSEDGRKVRWKGGSRVTKTSSYGGGSSRDRTDDDSQSPRKKLKTGNGRGAQTSGAASQKGNGTSARKSQDDRLMYTPLFSHRSSSSDSAVSSSEADEEDDSPLQHQLGAGSSAMTSSGVRTVVAPRKKKSHDTGPIIFYNNARFCTDLSGDSTLRGSSGAPNYKTPTLAPVGRTPVHEGPGHIFEKRGPLEEATLLPEPMDLADNPIPDSQELAFPPSSPPKPGNRMQTQPPVNLEVTGMGGVYPADNFAINIESRHAIIDQDEAPSVPISSTTKNLPDRFAKILQSDDPQRKVRAAVAQRYLNIQCVEHPPSALPPAQCFVPDDESMSDGEESDPIDEMSVSPSLHDALPPSTAPQTMYMPDVDSEDDSDEDMEDEDDSSSDAESDGSLDLLATARKADPEAVLRKERQYDAEMAERLAEEIPAGSSAATAGGGSGFASPASGVDKREYRKAKEDARQKQRVAVAAPASLKPVNSGDSMDVQGQESSNESSDGEDDDDGN
ncbi:hypothetical protein Q7P35_008778 [Cladosporium inversicolor]